MRSVCGPSARPKQIRALKYNPCSLPLTASNLKESNVGEIICQGTIESSRRGTSHVFLTVLASQWEETVLLCAFEVNQSSVNLKATPITHSEGRQSFSLISKVFCFWHICSPVKKNWIASSNKSSALNDSCDLIRILTCVVYNIGLF